MIQNGHCYRKRCTHVMPGRWCIFPALDVFFFCTHDDDDDDVDDDDGDDGDEHATWMNDDEHDDDVGSCADRCSTCMHLQSRSTCIMRDVISKTSRIQVVDAEVPFQIREM